MDVPQHPAKPLAGWDVVGKAPGEERPLASLLPTRALFGVAGGGRSGDAARQTW